MECALCDAMNDKKGVFYLGELCFAVVIHHPNTEFHCLVLPKRHVTRVSCLTAEELKEIFDTIARLSSFIEKNYPGSAIIAMNRLSNSTQPHLHFHVFNSSHGGIRAFIAAKIGGDIYPRVSKKKLEELRDEYAHFTEAELID